MRSTPLLFPLIFLAINSIKSANRIDTFPSIVITILPDYTEYLGKGADSDHREDWDDDEGEDDGYFYDDVKVYREIWDLSSFSVYLKTVRSPQIVRAPPSQDTSDTSIFSNIFPDVVQSRTKTPIECPVVAKIRSYIPSAFSSAITFLSDNLYMECPFSKKALTSSQGGGTTPAEEYAERERLLFGKFKTVDLADPDSSFCKAFEVNINGVPAKVLVMEHDVAVSKLLYKGEDIWRLNSYDGECFYCIAYLKNGEPQLAMISARQRDFYFQTPRKLKVSKSGSEWQLVGFDQFRKDVDALRLSSAAARLPIDITTDEKIEDFVISTSEKDGIETRLYAPQNGYSVHQIREGGKPIGTLRPAFSCYLVECYAKDNAKLLRLHAENENFVYLSYYAKVDEKGQTSGDGTWKEIEKDEFHERYRDLMPSTLSKEDTLPKDGQEGVQDDLEKGESKEDGKMVPYKEDNQESKFWDIERPRYFYLPPKYRRYVCYGRLSDLSVAKANHKENMRVKGATNEIEGARRISIDVEDEWEPYEEEGPTRLPKQHKGEHPAKVPTRKSPKTTILSSDEESDDEEEMGLAEEYDGWEAV